MKNQAIGNRHEAISKKGLEKSLKHNLCPIAHSPQRRNFHASMHLTGHEGLLQK
jgi:hypothetical protein